MKKTLLSLLLGTSILGAQAQTTDETVSVGAGYANDVYYSLENGEVASIPRNNWDVGFSVAKYGSTIITNGGTGAALYQYPNGSAASWETMDTTGLHTWDILYNSQSSWSEGAFSRNESSWGEYSTITHFITGNKVYFIKLADDTFKKLFIQKLASGVYTFKYANIDGTDEVTSTIDKSDYTNKNFAYYSFQNDQAIDREPENTTWDLVFTKYVIESPYTYGVSGVLANNGVKLAQDNTAKSGESDFENLTFSENMDVIGYDWKKYDFASHGYSLKDSSTYFVENKNGDVYELIFTSFGGSTTGEYGFTQQKVKTAGIANEIQLTEFAVYPNPVSNGQATLTFSTENLSNTHFTLYNFAGQTVLKQQLNQVEFGTNNYTIDLNTLPQGVYTLSVSNGKQTSQERIIIQ